MAIVIKSVKLLVLDEPTIMTGAVYNLSSHQPIADANAAGWIYGRFGMPNAHPSFSGLFPDQQMDYISKPVPESEATHRVCNISIVSQFGREYLIGDVEFLDPSAYDLYIRGFVILAFRGSVTQHNRTDKTIHHIVAFELVALERGVDAVLAPPPPSVVQPNQWQLTPASTP